MRVIRLTVLFAAVGWSLAAAADDGPGEGWTLQFSDDFERPGVGGDWQAVGGDWQISDGMLRADAAATIVCIWRFAGSVRLEFDAVATGGGICDLSAILDTVPGGGVDDGLFFGFGSEHNTASKLLVRGREVRRHEARIVPGRPPA